MIRLLQTRRAFVAILALGLICMAARGVADPDVWWHLRTGQLMIQNHSLFHTDPYSFTRFGQPWVNHEWLSQILIFGLYRVAGFGGLIVGFAGVIASTLLLVFMRCPGRPYLAALMTLWGAVASAPAWGVRPQMLSLLLASIFLVLLEASEKRPGLLWWTPPLMLLWVNLHAGYPVGLVFLALFLLGEGLEAAVRSAPSAQSTTRLRNLALALAVSLAVVPLNPNGLKIFIYPFETLRSTGMQKFIQEWSSPNFHDPMYAPFLLMLLALMTGLAVSPQRPSIRDLVLLLATIPGALRSIRHIPIAVLILIPILARLAEGWLRQRGSGRLLERGQSEPTRRILLVNALVLISFTAFTVARVRHVVSLQPETEARHFPVAGTAFLARERPPGPIMNHYNWGGYFIWTLYPGYRVFLDGRADVYGDQFMDQFAASYYLTDDWKMLLQQWGIRTLILPPDAPLIKALQAGGGWKQIYADSEAVVMVKQQ